MNVLSIIIALAYAFGIFTAYMVAAVYHATNDNHGDNKNDEYKNEGDDYNEENEE